MNFLLSGRVYHWDMVISFLLSLYTDCNRAIHFVHDPFKGALLQGLEANLYCSPIKILFVIIHGVLWLLGTSSQMIEPWYGRFTSLNEPLDLFTWFEDLCCDGQVSSNKDAFVIKDLMLVENVLFLTSWSGCNPSWFSQLSYKLNLKPPQFSLYHLMHMLVTFLFCVAPWPLLALSMPILLAWVHEVFLMPIWFPLITLVYTLLFVIYPVVEWILLVPDLYMLFDYLLDAPVLSVV